MSGYASVKNGQVYSKKPYSDFGAACQALRDMESAYGYSKVNENNVNENKNMKKNVVKINENTLRKIVAESVKKVLNEGYNQQIVDEAIQAIFSIEDVVDRAKTQVGFNPNEGNREVAQLIMQIGTLIYRLKRTVYADDYQEKWDRETHEQD